MKVKELIEVLQEENPEDEVILSCDSEGNNYSPLEGFGAGCYIPVSGGCLGNLDPVFVMYSIQEANKEYGEKYSKLHRAIVLYPRE